MSKIGTAHVEIKPVLNAEAITEITEAVGKLCKQIQTTLSDAIAAGLMTGMATATQHGEQEPSDASVG